MNQAHRFLLWAVLGCFVLIAGVFIWSQVYEAQTHFLAGTHPRIDAPKTASPTLPPLHPSDPSRGSKDTHAITIVEFADYDCLYCRLIQSELASAIQASKQPVRFIWRDLPIPNGRPDGLVAALAARCAGDQGKFWDLHDKLFQLTTLDLASIKNAAQTLSLEMGAFNSCITSGKYLSAIEQDVQDAKAHNINAAPTLFIGTDVISGYADANELTQVIHWASPSSP